MLQLDKFLFREFANAPIMQGLLKKENAENIKIANN